MAAAVAAGCNPPSGASGTDAEGGVTGTSTDPDSSTGAGQTTDDPATGEPTSAGASTSTGGDTSGSESSGGVPGAELTDEQRIAFAHYYSPIIFKKAAETSGTAGRDWITNFDFDRDGWQLSNNRENWEERLDNYLDGAQPSWRIRPTLYTAVIEFERGGMHSIVLLYHIYHAFQGDGAFEDIVPEAASIHDWERVEVRVDGVSGDPGTTDFVNYVVVTRHSHHDARVGDAPDLHFVDTTQGHHPMIFQAEHDDPLGVGFAELRFSATSAETLWAQTNAELDINDDPDDQNFHYIYVSEGDPELADMLGAVRLGSRNATSLASGENGGVDLDDVPRIIYEHQDLADVLLSHWDAGVPNTSWKDPAIPILLDAALVDEAGVEEVPAGMQNFFAEALDDQDDEEDRRGYPRKHWFFGAYRWGHEGSFWSEAFELGTPNGMRCVANGHADCLDNFMHQHDYYAHIGVAGDGSDDGEQGEWLPAGWATPEQNGFDGRWIQLFDDEVD